MISDCNKGRKGGKKCSKPYVHERKRVISCGECGGRQGKMTAGTKCVVVGGNRTLL